MIRGYTLPPPIALLPDSDGARFTLPLRFKTVRLPTGIAVFRPTGLTGLLIQPRDDLRQHVAATRRAVKDEEVCLPA